MASLLVTGGAGFIGANFVHYWLNKYPDDQVTVLDSLTYAGNLATLQPLRERKNFRFVQADINHTDTVTSLLKSNAIDTLVHFAAESHVDRSITGPDAFIEANILGTHSLLKAARNAWLAGDGKAHRFHHISTDEVFGSLEPNDPAFSESNPYLPNSPYSASKAASDHLVRSYHHTYGLQVSTSNCSNNYGPFHFPEKLIPLCITNILRGLPLPIYGDGKQIRDWLYVEDHCQGIDLILKEGRVDQCYNIGGNNEWANIDIVKTVCKRVDEAFQATPELAIKYPASPCATGNPAESLITYVEDRAGHDRRYAIDATKIETELGYKPVESFESGIQKTVDWYLRNDQWWNGILDGSYRNLVL
jgi:dTDP-glucose 4,6-dehydratase